MPSPATDSPGLVVTPFAATTYAATGPEALARLTSPAYDLVTDAGRERLAAADPHNVVRLILPTVGGPDDDPAAQAARTLTAWRSEGVLVDDPVPALWLYRMSGPGGATTSGWLGAVQLPPEGSTAVLPHEDVHPPAVAGRRRLLEATGTDLEPIVLAHDASAEIDGLTRRVAAGSVDLCVPEADGVRHEVWRVTDPELLARLTAAFGTTAAVIADGHHRFAAARAHAAGGSGQVLALLTPMGPGGLRVQAIHRVVPGLRLPEAARSAATAFTVTERPTDDVAGAAAAWLTEPAPGRFLLTDGAALLELHDPTAAARDTVPAAAPASWRSLDVVLAHHALLTGSWGRPDDPGSVLVAHDVDEALQLARDRSGVALLLRSPSPADVAAVARAGARMPRKSTLFVPKPRTGLVLRRHDGTSGTQR